MNWPVAIRAGRAFVHFRVGDRRPDARRRSDLQPVGSVAEKFASTDRDAAIEQRLAAATRYLSSDELEGRGLGTKGIDLAADYIADHLGSSIATACELTSSTAARSRSSGSASTPPSARTTTSHRRPAQRQAETRPGSNSRWATSHAVGDQRQRPLRPAVVFAGYGITARKAGYDDSPASMWRTRRWSCSATSRRRSGRQGVGRDQGDRVHVFATRLPTLRARRAAVILCSDQAEMRRRRHKEDTLFSFHVAGTTFTHPDVPVITCRRSVIDRILQAVDETGSGRDRRPDRPHAQARQPRTDWLANPRRDGHAARHTAK